MKLVRIQQLILAAVLSTLVPSSVFAFCGFYVAKADSSLYNKASQVVMVNHDNKTVISMMNDYRGDLNEFALVVPVPVVLQKGQINVGDRSIFERIDAFTAPRLVEYFDPNPCQMYAPEAAMDLAGAPAAVRSKAVSTERSRSLGVTVEAEYTVGEYDIVILSAKESNGLETWLHESGYNIPQGARQALKPYIKQNLKFFVAKVNLEEQARTGLTYLRPLQFAFDSRRFMLPIRLGMINADGPQEILLYVLTKNGRVETTNYRTVKLPTGMDIPVFVKEEFKDFYLSMFDQQVRKENMRTVFTEYFWNMGWCDPCSADPLSQDELRKLGVFWLDDQPDIITGSPRRRFAPPPRQSGPVPVMVTRLHLRYTADTFPEDLLLQETQDQANYQARYVLRHPWKGSINECRQAENYFDELAKRQEREAETLASLTGWDISVIRDKQQSSFQIPVKDENGGQGDGWWKNLW
ncbi:MAG: DUF2330 domain-containing protein [Bdellovibrionales bacterium]|nr:DUF2330 domain-containing protein [Bdellovibrionales bacterium]